MDADCAVRPKLLLHLRSLPQIPLSPGLSESPAFMSELLYREVCAVGTGVTWEELGCAPEWICAHAVCPSLPLVLPHQELCWRFELCCKFELLCRLALGSYGFL